MRYGQHEARVQPAGLLLPTMGISLASVLCRVASNCAHATATSTGAVGQSRRAPDEDDLNHGQLEASTLPPLALRPTGQKAHHKHLSLSSSHMFHTHWQDNASRWVDNQAPDVQAEEVSVRRDATDSYHILKQSKDAVCDSSFRLARPGATYLGQRGEPQSTCAEKAMLTNRSR